jgi:hypothetical protein
MKKRLVLIGGLCLAFIFVAVMVSSLLASRNSATEVCKRFVKAAATNDAQTSYNLFTEAAKKQTPLGNWQSTVSKLQKVYGTNPQFLTARDSPSMNPATQTQEDTVVLTVQGTAGLKYDVTCDMQKANGFQVDGFSSHLAE